MRLLLDKIKLALQKRTRSAQTKKCYATWAAKGYAREPEVSVVIESHNKSLQVCHVVDKLRKYDKGPLEIIVIDDGSTEEHTQRLVRFLTGGNEFLIRANDLYEVTTYDKAIRFSNGRYIALLQDDDDFDTLDWIDRAVGFFRQHPKLAVIGGKDGLDIAFDHDTQIAHGGGITTTGAVGFQFVMSVNRAPMWVERQLFTNILRHIDQDFAPFQFDDYELCARAWLNGLQVGWYDAGFKSLSTGGMRLYNNQFTTEQHQRNGHRLYTLYAGSEADIRQRMAENKG